jgi:hypothetical protein
MVEAERAVALRSIDEMLASEVKPKGRKAIVKAVTDALDTEGTTDFVTGKNREALIDAAKDLCPKNPECYNVVGAMFMLYSQTGNEEYFDAAELAWVSVPYAEMVEDSLVPAWREEFADIGAGTATTEDATARAAPTDAAVGPTIETLCVEQLFVQLRKQKGGRLDSVKPAALRRQVDALWRDYGDVLSTFENPHPRRPDESLTEESMREHLRQLERGFPGENWGTVWNEQLAAAGYLTGLFIAIYEWTDDDALRKRVRLLADMAFDYGVTQPRLRGSLDMKRNREWVLLELDAMLDLSGGRGQEKVKAVCPA